MDLEELKQNDIKKYEYVTTWDKSFVIGMLTDYLDERFNCKYLYSLIEDINGKSADAMVLSNSKLFVDNVEGQYPLNYDIEHLIDKRYTDNKGEVILLDSNGFSPTINIEYLANTVNSSYSPYSAELKNYLDVFVNFLINKRLENK